MPAALEAATGAGIAEADLLKAMETDEAGQTIEEVYTIANRLGLTGTPSYVVGNEVVMGAVGYEQLSEKLDAMKNCGQTTCLNKPVGKSTSSISKKNRGFSCYN